MTEGEWERVKEKTPVCHGGGEGNAEGGRDCVCACVKGLKKQHAPIISSHTDAFVCNMVPFACISQQHFTKFSKPLKRKKH